MPGRCCAAQSGEWGGEPEIRAAEELADRYVQIWSTESAPDKYGEPDRTLEGLLLPESVPPLRLTRHDEIHYNTLLPTARGSIGSGHCCQRPLSLILHPLARFPSRAR